jgi:hypothetical protein
VIVAGHLPSVYAHIAGLPVEETILPLATAGAALVTALRLTRERARRWTGRLSRRAADRR